MTRVVIDANYAGRGHFNVSRLERLADKVDGLDVTFVVPRVVVWEWAEHAHSARASLARHHAEFKVDPSVVSLPSLPGSWSVEQFAERILELLPVGFEVWDPAPDDFREAVSAQVLQIGAGEAKKGVKTGAADQLVFLCAIAQCDERQLLEPVILATGDKALKLLCKESAPEGLLCARDDLQLLSGLLHFVPARDELSESVEAELFWQVNSSSTEIGEALHRFSMGFGITSRRHPPSAREHEQASLGRAEILELHELELAEASASNRPLGTASIRLFGPVTMTTTRFEQVGEDEFDEVAEDRDTLPGIVDLKLTLIFERDWTIASVEAVGPAEISFER